MLATFENCVITRVFPSSTKQGRLYVDLVDLDDSGNKFSFSCEDIAYQDLLSVQGKQGSLNVRLESYTYDNKVQWKGKGATFKPSKLEKG